VLSIANREDLKMEGMGVELDCLEGVRVVDFTQFEAGPSCTEALAWLGAEVVKIENPGLGDPGRRLRRGQPDDDPWYFHQFNANKKSVTLNLKSPRGLEIVKNLLKKADITIENMAPGTIERLGLGYDVVKELNPGIIYCQVKGFGAGSPYEKNLAFDMIAQAAGGPTSVTGYGDRPPVKPGPSFGDTGTGMLMAISILGALRKRDRTGKGQRLQIAMQDAMIHYMRVPFSRTQLTGNAQLRGGSDRSQPGGLVPSALYPCKPGGPNDYVYVFTSRANPEHWTRLLKVIGREDLVGDPRYDTNQARSARAPEVDEIIAQWTRQHSKEEAMKIIGQAGVPAGAVFDTLELMNDPSLAERGIMQDVEHPTTGKYKMPAWPVRFDGAPPKVKPSPLLGQHNAQVLGGWLGIGTSEIEALSAEGII
jgi:crotonobetainyl-CoA:carnitine CoA-transferase CaiB-like acyl-CoA transferase